MYFHFSTELLTGPNLQSDFFFKGRFMFVQVKNHPPFYDGSAKKLVLNEI
jgi:hypothetical protein